VCGDSNISDEIVGDQEVKEKVRPVPPNFEFFASVTRADPAELFDLFPC
jgi:hypothetical protein